MTPVKIENPLLEKLSQAFDDGRTFDTAFIEENNLSLEEMIAFTNQLTAVLRGFLSAPADIQYAILLSGVSTDNPPLVKAIWDSGIEQATKRPLDELLKKLDGSKS